MRDYRIFIFIHEVIYSSHLPLSPYVTTHFPFLRVKAHVCHAFSQWHLERDP